MKSPYIRKHQKDEPKNRNVFFHPSFRSSSRNSLLPRCFWSSPGRFRLSQRQKCHGSLPGWGASCGHHRPSPTAPCCFYGDEYLCVSLWPMYILYLYVFMNVDGKQSDFGFVEETQKNLSGNRIGFSLPPRFTDRSGLEISAPGCICLMHFAQLDAKDAVSAVSGLSND